MGFRGPGILFSSRCALKAGLFAAAATRSNNYAGFDLFLAKTSGTFYLA
jgi:hypothetical protein